MTIYLIFHQHLNFIATHVDARSWNADFSTIFGRKQPMRGELANSILKAKIEIKQIGGSEIFLWTWSCLGLKCMFLEADSEYELENFNFQNFWFFFFS